jgi:hypothetical protein
VATTAPLSPDRWERLMQPAPLLVGLPSPRQAGEGASRPMRVLARRDGSSREGRLRPRKVCLQLVLPTGRRIADEVRDEVRGRRTRTLDPHLERVTRGVRQVPPSTYGQLRLGRPSVESVPYAQLGCVGCKSALKAVGETRKADDPKTYPRRGPTARPKRTGARWPLAPFPRALGPSSEGPLSWRTDEDGGNLLAPRQRRARPVSTCRPRSAPE